MINIGDKVQVKGDGERAFIVTKIVGETVSLRVARLARFDRQRFSTAMLGDVRPYSDAAKVAREAAKAQKAKTCQICARAIHAATGVIAHHGYQRPSYGWQTASCDGARYKPFEVSCERLSWYVTERIPAWIGAVENLIARLQVPGVEVPGPSTYLLDAAGKIQYRNGRAVYHKAPIGAGAERYAYFLRMAQEAAAGELKSLEQHRAEQQARLDSWKPAGV